MAQFLKTICYMMQHFALSGASVCRIIISMNLSFRHCMENIIKERWLRYKEVLDCSISSFSQK